MEKKKVSFLKVFLSMLFAIGVLAMYFYVIFKGDLKYSALSFSCVAACFVLSAIFFRFTSKKFFITLALAINVAADLMFMTSVFGKVHFDKMGQVVLYLFCGVQLMYALYNLSLYKGIGLKIVNVAVRVAVCLLVYYILPKYVAISTVQMICLVYFINGAITILGLLYFIKTQWLLILGLLLSLAGSFFMWLMLGGGLQLLHISLTTKFVEILFGKYSLWFICYIPGLLLIALSSVWAKFKKKD